MRETQTFMLFCIISALSLHMSAQSVHQVCIFHTRDFSPEKKPGLMQTTCRTRADFADLVQTFADVLHTFFEKVCVSQTMQTFEKSARPPKSGMQTCCTLSPLGAKSA